MKSLWSASPFLLCSLTQMIESITGVILRVKSTLLLHIHFFTAHRACSRGGMAALALSQHTELQHSVGFFVSSITSATGLIQTDFIVMILEKKIV